MTIRERCWWVTLNTCIYIFFYLKKKSDGVFFVVVASPKIVGEQNTHKKSKCDPSCLLSQIPLEKS